MKISKLFHWMYAFLMMLPIFAVGVKCGYVMLNKNANDSYRGSYSFEAQVPLNEVDEPFIDRNNWTYDSNYHYTSDLYFDNFNISSLPTYSNSRIGFNIDVNNTTIPNFTLLSTTKSIVLDINVTYDYIYLRQYSTLIDSSINLDTYYNFTQNSMVVPFSAIITTTDNTIYSNFGSGSGVNFLPYFNKNTYYVDTTLSSVFYSAIQELDKVSFFSWAKDSFLAEPFMYIGNLFGIPNVHPIFTFLSYWMAISVIWLVFDLFMYVPLLCHRWIDKGIRE